MQRQLSVERLERIAVNAILGGYGRQLEWDEFKRTPEGAPYARDPLFGRRRRIVELLCSMDCEVPSTCELFARYSAEHAKKVLPMTIIVRTRCRKCTACRERRAMFWRGRAVSEFLSSERTLFGTLTVAPENDVALDCIARIEMSEIGVDFDCLDDQSKFLTRCKIGGREITKYLKRLRAGDTRHVSPQFRYLLVAEAHNGEKTTDLKRGRPHWHCLIHEVDLKAPLVNADEWASNLEGSPITDRYGNPQVGNSSFLKCEWKLGFSSFALCRTPQAAGYVCKYLSKAELSVRLRASFKYGGEKKASGYEPSEIPSQRSETSASREAQPVS